MGRVDPVRIPEMAKIPYNLKVKLFSKKQPFLYFRKIKNIWGSFHTTPADAFPDHHDPQLREQTVIFFCSEIVLGFLQEINSTPGSIDMIGAFKSSHEKGFKPAVSVVSHNNGSSWSPLIFPRNRKGPTHS